MKLSAVIALAVSIGVGIHAQLPPTQPAPAAPAAAPGVAQPGIPQLAGIWDGSPRAHPINSETQTWTKEN